MADEAAADADNWPHHPLTSRTNRKRVTTGRRAAGEILHAAEQFDSVHHTLANLPDDGLDAVVGGADEQTQVVLTRSTRSSRCA